MQRNNGKIHLVGSVPGDSAQEVFELCAGNAGRLLASLPDGETGYRRAYINFLAYKIYLEHPDVEAVSRPLPIDPGDPDEWRKPGEEWLGRNADLSDLWKFRVKDGVDKIRFETLGYADAAIESYRVFRETRDKGIIPDGVRFQVSIPNTMDAVMPFITSFADLRRFMAAVDDAMARDIKKILAAIPHDDLAIQWDNVSSVMRHEMQYTGQTMEMPFKVPLIFRLMMSNPTRGFRRMLKLFATRIPDDVLFGIHFCYGDLGHKHGTEPKDLSVCVFLANQADRHAGRRVDWVHMPVPRDRKDDDYFSPLSDLNIGARLFLGLVHHTGGVPATLERMKKARKYVDDFGVATECGFGRRPKEQIPALLDIHKAAVEAI